MSPQTYGKTNVTTHYPWGLMAAKGTRLLCSDGVIRAPHRLASTADTFFSVPAAMRIRGKYITGYMTTEEALLTERKPLGGLAGEYCRAYVFRQHTGQGETLPEWPRSFEPQMAFLISKAYEAKGNA